MNITESKIEEKELRFLELFPTPVLIYWLPDGDKLVEELKPLVHQKMKETEGKKITNVGGWTSPRHIEEKWKDDNGMQKLLSYVNRMKDEVVKRTVNKPKLQHFNNWQMDMWVNVNLKGSYNSSHMHLTNGSVWSGIFYVDAGEKNSGGSTVFENHSKVPKEIINNTDPFENEFKIAPTEGMMVLFPASLRHYVERYNGDSPRIVIAFNLQHKGFVIPIYHGFADHMKERKWMWKNFRGLMFAFEKAENLVHKILYKVKRIFYGISKY